MKGPDGGGSAHLLRLWSTGSGAWLQRTTLSRAVTDVEIIRLIQTFSVAKQTTKNIMKWAGSSYYNSQ